MLGSFDNVDYQKISQDLEYDKHHSYDIYYSEFNMSTIVN